MKRFCASGRWHLWYVDGYAVAAWLFSPGGAGCSMRYGPLCESVLHETLCVSTWNAVRFRVAYALQGQMIWWPFNIFHGEGVLVGEMVFKLSQGVRVRVCVRYKWTLLHSLNLPCVLVRIETHSKVCYAFWSGQKRMVIFCYGFWSGPKRIGGPKRMSHRQRNGAPW